MIDLEAYKKARIAELNNRLDEISSIIAIDSELSERTDPLAMKIKTRKHELFGACFKEMVDICGELDRLEGSSFDEEQEDAK